MAEVDRINLRSDPRVEHRDANLNGFLYHYLYGEPKNYKATILMVSLGLSLKKSLVGKEWCLRSLRSQPELLSVPNYKKYR